MRTLEQIAALLGEDERRVLTEIALRLEVGAAQYGALDIARDRRQWSTEASEEFMDAAVYLAIAMLRARGDA